MLSRTLKAPEWLEVKGPQPYHAYMFAFASCEPRAANFIKLLLLRHSRGTLFCEGISNRSKRSTRKDGNLTTHLFPGPAKHETRSK
jgi:hypothetical protein